MSLSRPGFPSSGREPYPSLPSSLSSSPKIKGRSRMSFFGGEQYVDLGVAAKFLAVATAASVGSSVITEHTWIPVGVAVAGGIGAIVLSWRAATYWAFMRADMRTLRNSVESLKQELREHVLREEKDLRSIHDRIEKRGRDQGEN